MRLDEKLTAGCEQRCAAAEQSSWFATDAQVVVHQQHGRPAALTGQRSEHITQQRRQPVLPGERDGRFRDVDTEGRDAAARQRGDEPAWPAANVEHRSTTLRKHRLIGGVDAGQPALDVQRDQLAVECTQVERAPCA